MKKVIISLTVMLFCACVSKNTVLVPMSYDSPPVSYRSGAETQIRQSVKISFKGKEFSFQGIVTFRNGGKAVRAAALTGFGIKIFEAEYSTGEETFFYMNNAFAKIPYFAEAVRHTIRRLYVEQFSGRLTSGKHKTAYTVADWTAYITTLNDGLFQIKYNNFRPNFVVTVVDIEISDLE